MNVQKIDTNVGHLVDMVQRGELRLPEMQRRYVWTATRVRDLLDSLYRGSCKELSDLPAPLIHQAEWAGWTAAAPTR